jgi:FkbM family methyltransferase
MGIGAFNGILTAIFSILPMRRKINVLDVAAELLIPQVVYFKLAKLGFKPSAIIDIGAYRGEWTRLISRFFPQTPILMIEAQTEKLGILSNVKRDIGAADLRIELLGKEDGAEVIFNVMESGSSVFDEQSDVPRERRLLKMRTLDSVLKDAGICTSPLFMKLDVQGAELDVLLGGGIATQNAEVIQLEVPLVEYNKGSPRLLTIISFMAERGFSIYDICGFIRPNHTHLAQMDLLFVRETSTLRKAHFTFS